MRRDFIANAAHELRTPLTNLQGYLEALRDGVIPADRATYDSLWEEAERLVRLSRSLDALAEGDAATEPARARRARPGGRDPDGRSTSRARRSSGPGLTRRASSCPTRLPARADPDQLAQVLAQPAPERGPLHAGRRHGDGPRASARPADVLVSVANTGEGIPAEDLARVFERFYRVEKSRDRARGGAGIGLAIVKQLVEAGGGRVGAESADGRTRFWFSLPALTAALTGHAPIATIPIAIPGAGPSPLDRLEPLAEERHGDDDRHRRPERRGEPDHPRRRRLEADANEMRPSDVEHARERRSRPDDRGRGRPRPGRRPARRSAAARASARGRRPRAIEMAALTPRATSRPGASASSRGRCRSRSSSSANRTSATTAKMTPGPANRVAAQAAVEGDAGEDDADRRDRRARRPGARSASRRGRRPTRTTVSPPYAATMPLTTAIGPIWSPVK